MADDLFDSRLTEQRNPRTVDIDLANPLEIVDLINAEDRSVPEAVGSQREQIARAIEIAVGCFKRGGRLIYVGAGTSGRLGILDATECPPTFGTEPEMVQGLIAGGQIALVRSQEGAEDRTEDGAAEIDEKDVGANDFVFGIATSSTTPYVRGALQRAVDLGAATGFFCCTEPGEEMRELVDVCVVPLVGPEVVAGSTRMKAGTATTLTLNLITTGAMIRLGKVYGNLMVDLRTMSQKLVDRSQRIVMAAAGGSREEAQRALDAAGGSAKLAIVMKSAGLSRELAELYLEESDGFVRGTLAAAEAVRSDRGTDDPFRHYPAEPPGGPSVEITLRALAALPQSVSAAVAAAPDELSSARPAEGKWCAKEQIEHLIESDTIIGQRIKLILSEEEPSIANRDDDVENQKVFDGGAREAPIESLLSRLRDSRARLVALVEEAPRSYWSRTCNHELYGPVSVYQTLRHIVWHDYVHLQAIRRLADN
jgi:N-acetylmuramic acid 6-phosphate etherase